MNLKIESKIQNYSKKFLRFIYIESIMSEKSNMTDWYFEILD